MGMNMDMRTWGKAHLAKGKGLLHGGELATTADGRGSPLLLSEHQPPAEAAERRLSLAHLEAHLQRRLALRGSGDAP